MSSALGAARALLTRSYLGVQNALLSARDALRIAVHEGDGALAELARARLRAAQREDLIAEVDGTQPLVRVEIQTEGGWRADGTPTTRERASEHFDRLCRALKFNGAWAEQNLDLRISAVRIVDDRRCYAYWNAATGCTTLMGSVASNAETFRGHEGAAP